MTRATFIAALLAIAACQHDSSVGSDFLAPPDALPDAEPLPVCIDDRDNDGDSLTDYPFDPGCTDPNDPDETDPATPPACSDGADNDGDSLTDFPLEPGCESAADDDETDPATPPECSDGIDNDGDDLIDYPDDPGCQSAAGAMESIVTD